MLRTPDFATFERFEGRCGSAHLPESAETRRYLEFLYCE
jgi:hypothetical protein